MQGLWLVSLYSSLTFGSVAQDDNFEIRPWADYEMSSAIGAAQAFGIMGAVALFAVIVISSAAAARLMPKLGRPLVSSLFAAATATCALSFVLVSHSSPPFDLVDLVAVIEICY